MNKLEKAILLELKKELNENLGNDYETVANKIRNIIVNSLKNEINPQKPADQTNVPNQTAVSDQPKPFGRVMVESSLIQEEEDPLKKAEEILEGKINAELLQQLDEALSSESRLFSALNEFPRKKIFKLWYEAIPFFSGQVPSARIFGKKFIGVSNASFVNVVKDLLISDTVKINDIEWDGKTKQLILFLKGESYDDNGVKEICKMIMVRALLGVKPKLLLSNNLDLESVSNIQKSVYRKPFPGNFFKKVVNFIRTRIVVKYNKDELGFVLFSDQSDNWVNKPQEYNNWIDYFKSLELNEEHIKQIALEIKNVFIEKKIDPYKKEFEFVEEDGQTPNPLEILIEFIKEHSDDSEVFKNVIKPTMKNAAIIYNKENHNKDIDGLINPNSLNYYTTGENGGFAKRESSARDGFALLNYLLSKKKGDFVLQEGVDLSSADDPFLQEILKAVYEIGQQERDKKAEKRDAREKGRTEPKEWQRYMRSFQASYAPAIGRFRSTIGELLDKLKTELRLKSGDDLVETEESENPAEEEGVINKKALEATQKEIESYQEFITEIIVPVIKSVTVEEFDDSITKWKDSTILEPFRGENIFNNEKVKKLVKFENPIQIAYKTEEGAQEFVPLRIVGQTRVNTPTEETPPTSEGTLDESTEVSGESPSPEPPSSEPPSSEPPSSEPPSSEPPTEIGINNVDPKVMKKVAQTIGGLVALQLRVIGKVIDDIKGEPLEKITVSQVIKKMREADFDVDEKDIEVAERSRSPLGFISDAFDYLKQLFGFKREVWDSIDWEDEEQADLAVKAFIQNGEKSGWDYVKRAIEEANLDPENLSKEGKRLLVKNLVKSDSKDYIKIDNEYFKDERVNTSIIIEKTASNIFKKVSKKEIAKRIENAAKDEDGFLQIYGIPLENISQEKFDDFIVNVLNNVANPSGTTPLNLLTKIRDQVQTPEEISREDLGTFEDIIARSQKTRHNAGKFKEKSSKYFQDEASNRDDRLQEKLEKTINNYINKRKQQWQKRTM